MAGIYINGAGSTKNFSTQQFDASKWKNAIVVRASDATTAASLASTMNSIIAQSQAGQLTYSQASRSGIYNGLGNGSTSADCSSAVSYAVRVATGISNFNTATGNGVSMANALEGTGAFMSAFNYVDNATTPLCEGDILIYANGGHTAIVVDGTVRNGSNDQLYTNVDRSRAISTNWADYVSTGRGKYTTREDGEFHPRTEAPVIEPEDEHLPEELIEEIELGEVSKEELEEFYDMYFIYEGRGGYSPFSDVPLTNQSYAWNRFAEVLGLGQSCCLTHGNPGSWMNNNGDGYTRDMAPELGAAMCFSGPGGGYACIVEAIEAGEVLVTSQVEHGEWSLQSRQKRYGAWDFDSYMFTGFIHNPAVYMGAQDETALETFLRIAEESVGGGHDWVLQQTGIYSPNGWSAAFVTACSKRAGSSLNIVIPNTDSVSTIGRVGVLRGMGTWHKGSIYGGGYWPSAGDIAIFRYRSTGKESVYQGDKAVIVVESDGGSFSGVMGDDSGHITKKSYNCHSGYIAGYFCPNWESIDGTTASKKEYRNIQGLYTNGVTKYDATARTVGHINGAYKPSIHSTKVKLAAVNYTGLLANMYSVFGQASTSTATNAELVIDYWTNTVRSYYQVEGGDFSAVSGETVNLTGLISEGVTSSLSGTGYYGGTTTAADVSVTATAQEIFDYLKGKGLNDAAATGILANLQAESGLRTGAIGDSGTSAGLAQWHNNRFTNMKNYVGENWATNVTGQLDFLWSELQSGYKRVLNKLQQVENTAEGARQATNIWIHDYEVPQGYDDPTSSVYTKRQELSNGYWEKVGQ